MDNGVASDLFLLLTQRKVEILSVSSRLRVRGLNLRLSLVILLWAFIQVSKPVSSFVKMTVSSKLLK